MEAWPNLNIILIAGIPGSGKSTFSILLKEMIESFFKHVLVEILEVDKVEQEMINNSKSNTIGFELFNSDIYTESRDKAKILMKEWLSMNSKSSDLKFVIIDDDFLIKSSRKPYKNLALEFKASFTIIHLDTKMEIAILNNKKRDKKIPNSVIQSSFEKFEISKNRFFIAKSKFNFEKWISSLHSKIPFKEESKPKMIQPIRHEIDLYLRKFVSEMLISPSKIEDLTKRFKKEEFGKKLSKMKKEFLKISEKKIKKEIKEDYLRNEFFEFVHKEISNN